MTVSEFNPVQTTPFKVRIKIKIHLWKLINSTLFRWIPNQIKKPRIFLLRLFGAEIANTVSISRTAIIDLPWNLKMGHLSSLGDNSWTYCLDKIEIGEKCCIGKDVYLLTGSHSVQSPKFALNTKAIKINDCCWIATGSYILPGIVLGKFSVIGAKSVVTKNTEDYDIVGGNPAKFIKKRKINF